MKKNLIHLFIFSSVIITGSASAQVGGEATYRFLDLTNSARAAALGGKIIAIDDGDINNAYHNPALLNKSADQNISLNYVNYFTGINFGYASYAWNIDTIGTFAAGVHYIDYGDFIKADQTGKILGGFGANDMACYFSFSRSFDSVFRWGITLKPIFSVLESYSSLGLASDFGITYSHKSNGFSASFVVRNLGHQITTYTTGDYEPMPTEIMLGFSQRLKYAPFRFSIIAQHLEHPNMIYDLPEGANAPETNTSKPTALENTMENILRHAIVGVEILPTNNFYVAVAYNYQRRKELQFVDKPGLVGFSWGFGMKVKRYHISYGRATYHLAGGSNHFTISSNLAEFYHR